MCHHKCDFIEIAAWSKGTLNWSESKPVDGKSGW